MSTYFGFSCEICVYFYLDFLGIFAVFGGFEVEVYNFVRRFAGASDGRFLGRGVEVGVFEGLVHVVFAIVDRGSLVLHYKSLPLQIFSFLFTLSVTSLSNRLEHVVS